MKYRFLFLAIVAIAYISNAQDLDYGDVSKLDFEIPSVEGDQDAHVIYRSVEVRFEYVPGEGFSQLRNVQERIKINSEKGLEYATHQVRLYNKNNRTKEKMTGLKGATYTMVDGKVKKTKLRRSGTFEEDLDDVWKQESFTMPNVNIGSIVEYEYTIRSPFPSIDDIDLQYTIPIANLHVKVEMLEYYVYNVMFNPRANYLPSFDKTSGNQTFFVGNGAQTGAASNRTARNEILSLDTNNVPALTPEPMSGSLENYRAKMIIELSGSRFPQEPYENFASSWEDVSKKILDHPNFGDQLKNTRFFRDELEALLYGVTSDQEKMMVIYEMVKSKIKWDGYYGKFARKGIKEAYKEGAGNVADINLFLIAAFKEAGLTSYPVLLSSKSHGIPLFPTQDGFNYVIASVQSEKGLILLDATEPNAAPNLLPVRALNWQGRVIKEGGQSSWVSLMSENPTKELIMMNLSLDDDLVAKGAVQRRQTDYRAYHTRNETSGQKDKLKKMLVDDAQNLNISDLKVDGYETKSSPITFKYNLTYKDAAEKIGDKIYLTPLLFEANDENPFKKKERNLPVDLRYPFLTKTIVNIDIPEGYEVESLPESKKLVFGDNIGSYSYYTSLTPGAVNIRAEFEMTQSLVMPDLYPSWREFFISIVDLDAEKIVLKKI
ncbi:DUF3857 domain-containing protein [Nonlabens xiamenensis]|uniref:DUF3857 domain-containing protein n=1 Tax=Nonlabens xiamenensis TaxID=2341043 RepID=UPI000F60C24B|nr:DUF3857 domain-containing protein [Nonlabens xiamenensis]